MDLEIKKQKFIELRAGEVSLEKISKIINISKPTLIKWCKDFKLEIHNQKSILIDSLREEFQLSRKENIEFVKSMLTTVNSELSLRKLSDLPTDKLFKLHLELKSELINSLSVSFKGEKSNLDLDFNTEVSWEG